ncbi:hypothetical protein AXF42_Ash000846 [Apostasia shenzhenica]|uniref:Uncharacterized protein n=1 Tax=Apostasia shenzhenica TaxID=1088818 RepID=A0A2I0AT78_9ASPA|nr:hypothetical protein AXF42_Ash000846 [Apostasia shenzhenica]
MSADFSPCGRFLVACAACVVPHLEADLSLHSQMNLDTVDASTSPTLHMTLCIDFVYLYTYLNNLPDRFGAVLPSRAIRAAHCLTSIQVIHPYSMISYVFDFYHTSQDDRWSSHFVQHFILRKISIEGKNGIMTLCNNV